MHIIYGLIFNANSVMLATDVHKKVKAQSASLTVRVKSTSGSWQEVECISLKINCIYSQLIPYTIERPLRKKKFQKNFSHQKTFYLAQKNGGLEKKFFENIASKASEQFSNFRK